jgi:AraC-like DNA-binding protein
MLDTFQNGSVGSIGAAKGELVFIPKGSVYTGTYLEEDTSIHVIQFELMSGELPEYLKYPVKLPLANAGELIGEFFKYSERHPFYCLSCLYRLLWEIDNGYARPPKKYESLASALSYITEHPCENKKVSYYARLCNLSEPYFRRLFCEYTGKSPVEFRNDIRLSRAKNMLASGEYNVSDAAYGSGFSNLSFFIRLYKKKYGTTPKKD